MKTMKIVRMLKPMLLALVTVLAVPGYAKVVLYCRSDDLIVYTREVFLGSTPAREEIATVIVGKFVPLIQTENTQSTIFAGKDLTLEIDKFQWGDLVYPEVRVDITYS